MKFSSADALVIKMQKSNNVHQFLAESIESSIPSSTIGYTAKSQLTVPQSFSALIFCAAAGAFLGLSAPGYEHSYIAWFGLVPFMLAIFGSPNGRTAFARAFVFGAGYTLTYGTFLLTLNSAWAWISPEYTVITAAFWWLLCGLHQGIVFGIVGFIGRKLPLTSNLAPERAGSSNKLFLPVLIVMPLLWTIMLNKVGNSPMTLGFPWTMLEYSQYRNLELIQIAKYVGGIGIGAILVLANTAIFIAAISLSKTFSCSVLPLRSKFTAATTMLWVTIVLAGILSYGNSTLNTNARCGNSTLNTNANSESSTLNTNTTPDTKQIVASLIQGNISGKADGTRAAAILERYLRMSAEAPKGLCLWTEWAMPLNLSEPKSNTTLNGLLTLARLQGQTWLIGALEKDNQSRMFNTVYALGDNGKLVEPTYRKRQLVPFLEHMPEFISKTPLQNIVATISPGEVDMQPGTKPNVMNTADARVGTLICLEVVSPELVNSSVREGAEILADLSNTSWYHSPMVGQQLIAFSVMRAVETSRTVLFSTTTGPSAIIDPAGRIITESKPKTAVVLSNKIPINSEITPFVRWFH